MSRQDPHPEPPYQFTYHIGPGGVRMVGPEEAATMVSLYQEGLTCYEVAKRLDRTGRSVLNALEDAGVERRDASHAGKKWALKEDYFAVIDTPIKAYLLGVIYADGNVYHNRFKLAMWAVDEPFLLSVAQELGFDGTLYREKKRGPKRQDMVALTVYSQTFVGHLRDKGVIDNKTNRLLFPTWLRSDLKVHFVHGLLDGDGCITMYRNRKQPNVACHTVSFAGCYVVMDGLHQWFAAQGIVGHLRHNARNPLSGCLTFSGTKGLRVANLLYATHQPLCLLRKRDKHRQLVLDMDARRSRTRLATRPHIDHGLAIIKTSTYAA